MFRKPKRKGKKEGLRKRDDKDDGDTPVNADSNANGGANDASTSDLISEARKRLKTSSGAGTASKQSSSAAVMAEPKSYVHLNNQASVDTAAAAVSQSDLATRSALHLPTKEEQEAAQNRPAAGRGDDGIYRVDAKQNKFLAGPIKASQNIRVTARFDYQPDICKDYQQTGFCGFGDTCIYLHDRGDTVSGWQLEQQWEEQQRLKKEQQEKELNEFMDASRQGQKSENDEGGTASASITDDGLPFACHLCREYFKDPIVTTCQHYFCQGCIMDHIRQQQQATGATESSCPICKKDTHNVFHEPSKLVAKKRRVLGLGQSKQTDSWELFADALSKKQSSKGDEDGFDQIK